MRFAALVMLALGLTGCAASGLSDLTNAEGSAGIERGGATNAPANRRLNRDEAARYVLDLVNRARVDNDLPPVGWDETATRAAMRHSSDVARHGFTAHVGTDGSVPELRYTDAGGSGLVMENVGCFADNIPRALDPDATFDPQVIAKVESMFLNELPPHDGHRRNILAKRHTAVGIAVTGTVGLDFACVTEEFVDDYGSFAALPLKTRVGQMIVVSGELKAPAMVRAVGVSRVDAPRPRAPSELNNTGGYAIPRPFVTYFGKGWKTPRPVDIEGNRFVIDVALSDGDKPGLYGVSVWASFDGGRQLEMVSLRTVEVE